MANKTTYNRYTPQSGWKSVIAVPGRHLQSAELNEIQSIQDAERRYLASSAGIKDGTIVAGGAYHLTNLTLPARRVSIEALTVYYQAFHHFFSGGTINITGVGEETVGLLITATTQTEIDNPSLNDPATGNAAFGLPGAYRQVYTYTLVVNNPAAVFLYKFINGVIWTPPVVATVPPWRAELARRTNDESGSYLVSGLRCSLLSKDASTFKLELTSGKAYVQGWEWGYAATTVLSVDRPLDSMSDTAYKTYLTGTNTYTFPTTPVKTVNKLIVTLTATAQATVRGGSPGGTDLIRPISEQVIAVSSVTQGATTYTAGADYNIAGNYIDWSPGNSSNEPATGSTYYITYDYIQEYFPTTDFTYNTTTFTITNATKPKNGTTIVVDYAPYVGRIDRVSISKDGVITVTKGKSTFMPSPPVVPTGNLLVATIKMAPNCAATAATITHAELYRQTMLDLSDLRTLTKSLQYNAAVSELERLAYSTALSSTKKGIWTDSFVDFSRMDIGHSLLTYVNNIATKMAMIDFDQNLMSGFNLSWLPLTTRAPQQLAITSHAIESVQLSTTESMLVNKYAEFRSSCAVTLDPADDVSFTETVTNINTSEYLAGNDFARIAAWEAANVGVGKFRLVNQFGMYKLYVNDTQQITETRGTSLSRARTVTVSGYGFGANEDNIALTLDGTPYDFTAVSPTRVGSSSVPTTTVQANADGSLVGTFNIPAGLIGGEKHIVLSSANAQGEAIYSISSLQRTIVNNHRRMQIDPLAQTFRTSRDMPVSGVDLFFAQKDANYPVVVSINNVVNGYPSNEVLTQVMLAPSQVNVSSNGSVATQIRFPTPAWCDSDREYAIVVASNCNTYRVMTSTLGHKDLITGATVTKNPASGMLFSSPNASSWVGEPTSDLKYVLYGARLETTKTVTYNELTVDGSWFCTVSNQHVPTGCSVSWQYSINTATWWRPFAPGVTVDVGVPMTKLRIRAILTGDGFTTPTISGDCVVALGKWIAESAYVGRNVDMTTLGGTTFTGINIFCDINKPTGTTATMYYSTDGGTNWTNLGAGTSVTAVGDGFTQYTWSASGLSNPSQFKIYIKLTSSADRTLTPVCRRLMAMVI